jgi:hypothetical protein
MLNIKRLRRDEDEDQKQRQSWCTHDKSQPNHQAGRQRPPHQEQRQGWRVRKHNAWQLMFGSKTTGLNANDGAVLITQILEERRNEDEDQKQRQGRWFRKLNARHLMFSGRSLKQPVMSKTNQAASLPG